MRIDIIRKLSESIRIPKVLEADFSKDDKSLSFLIATSEWEWGGT